MERLQELLSIALIIVLLVIILFIVSYINKENYILEEKEEINYLDVDEILEIAKTNLDVVRDLARGAEIIDGPRLVTEYDREEISSIYPNYEPLYLIVLKKPNNNVYVVMNSTDVIHTIPLSYFN